MRLVLVFLLLLATPVLAQTLEDLDRQREALVQAEKDKKAVEIDPHTVTITQLFVTMQGDDGVTLVFGADDKGFDGIVKAVKAAATARSKG